MDISKFENITEPDFRYSFPFEVPPCITQPFEGGILHAVKGGKKWEKLVIIYLASSIIQKIQYLL